MRRAAGSDDNRFCLEDVKIARADVKACGAGNAFPIALVHQQVGHHDTIVDFGSSFAGGFRYNRLVALAVDHNLPLAFAQIAARLRVSHHWQAPFLELVHGRIDMSSNVIG